jgi:hypothetical protein
MFSMLSLFVERVDHMKRGVWSAVNAQPNLRFQLVEAFQKAEGSHIFCFPESWTFIAAAGLPSPYHSFTSSFSRLSRKWHTLTLIFRLFQSCRPKTRMRTLCLCPRDSLRFASYNLYSHYLSLVSPASSYLVPFMELLVYATLPFCW